MGAARFILVIKYNQQTALKPELKTKSGPTNILSICGVTVFLVCMPMIAYFAYRGSPGMMGIERMNEHCNHNEKVNFYQISYYEL